MKDGIIPVNSTAHVHLQLPSKLLKHKSQGQRMALVSLAALHAVGVEPRTHTSLWAGSWPHTSFLTSRRAQSGSGWLMAALPIACAADSHAMHHDALTGTPELIAHSQ